jgi:hypothetical protein
MVAQLNAPAQANAKDKGTKFESEKKQLCWAWQVPIAIQSS